MSNIYEIAKKIFNIPNEEFYEAAEICKNLKSMMLYNSGDILFVYRNSKEAEKEFWEYVSKYNEIYRGLTFDQKRRTINLPEDETIYFKSIYECKNKLDGYRFKKIQFRGEDYVKHL